MKLLPLDRMRVNFLFATMIFMNLLGNIDHGTLPAGSIAIKAELGLNNF